MSIDWIYKNYPLKISSKYISVQYNLFSGLRCKHPLMRFFNYCEISGYDGNYNGSLYILYMYVLIDPPVFHGTMP